MGKGVNFLGTLLVVGLLNLLVMLVLNTDFIEVSVIVGLVAIVIVRMFTSPSNFAKANRSGYVNKMETVQLSEQSTYVYPKIISKACITYTLVSLLITIIVYYDYFT